MEIKCKYACDVKKNNGNQKDRDYKICEREEEG
jgi:hypothetical protein